jgi:hypothetical protein
LTVRVVVSGITLVFILAQNKSASSKATQTTTGTTPLEAPQGLKWASLVYMLVEGVFSGRLAGSLLNESIIFHTFLFVCDTDGRCESHVIVVIVPAQSDNRFPPIVKIGGILHIVVAGFIPRNTLNSWLERLRAVFGLHICERFILRPARKLILCAFV